MQHACANTWRGEQTRLKFEVTEFIFVDPSDGFSAQRTHLKAWSGSEKSQVIDDLNSVFKRAPHLIFRCSRSKPINLLRVPRIYDEDNCPTSADAFATSQSILFPDAFFADKKTSRHVVHELAHVADASKRVSYSKKWANFASKPMRQVKAEVAQCSVGTDKNLELILRQKNVWPSIYGATNLVEAFAEYMAEFIEGSDYQISDHFKQSIAKPFLAPTKQELTYEQQFTLATDCQEKREYQRAISILTNIISEVPNNPGPYLNLVDCLTAVREYKRARVVATKCESLFRQAGITLSEDSYYELMLQLTWLNWRQRYYRVSKMQLNQLIQVRPLDERPVLYRGDLYRSQHQLAAASRDYLHAAYLHGCHIHRNYLQVLHLDNSEHYESTINKYEQYLKNNFSNRHSDKNRGVLREARKAMQHSNFSFAQQLCNKALSIDSQSIETRILLVDIYERSHKNSKAVREFSTVRRLIRRYQNSFSSLSWAST